MIRFSEVPDNVQQEQIDTSEESRQKEVLDRIDQILKRDEATSLRMIDGVEKSQDALADRLDQQTKDIVRQLLTAATGAAMRVNQYLVDNVRSNSQLIIALEKQYLQLTAEKQDSVVEAKSGTSELQSLAGKLDLLTEKSSGVLDRIESELSMFWSAGATVDGRLERWEGAAHTESWRSSAPRFVLQTESLDNDVVLSSSVTQVIDTVRTVNSTDLDLSRYGGEYIAKIYSAMAPDNRPVFLEWINNKFTSEGMVGCVEENPRGILCYNFAKTRS